MELLAGLAVTTKALTCYGLATLPGWALFQGRSLVESSTSNKRNQGWLTGAGAVAVSGLRIIK